MDNSNNIGDSFDSIKVYIWMMGGLTVIALGWLVYNWFVWGEYEDLISKGKRDLEKMLLAEKEYAELPPQIPDENKEIPDELVFFRNLNRLSPEIDIHPPAKGNKNGIAYTEKKYTISFQEVDRRQLIQYIYNAKQRYPFLKLKSIDMQRANGVEAYDDKWKVEIELAYRKLRP